ncbi:hypothetical protein TTHERM_00197950 (macronuclear) [Tetrahymena thermophila SB210]|uniref:Uncharacterized protein n=1 Tax=Tetrahymena thermophila (strain SB210) TaxID=312017 RepID=Q22NQ4_TETTS|nr:hypothetical protein TTHERM_00197950 [Tetrahymena thermophila SB210]EAR86731.1 hypothetical protein TTHERM_00197950 [Tetrahymena thermophila SB210]|eukprot:XP_001006976.1 hypothetical protein TTHERM_00197950 [Tetrahymena thermophila SB210]
MEKHAQIMNINEKSSQQKNKKRIQKVNKNQKKVLTKKVPNYSYIIIQEIPDLLQFHLFGDFYIDLNQLRNLDRIQVIQPVSFFKKTISVVDNKKMNMVEVTMSSGVSGMKEFRFVIDMIKTMQNKDLVFLIDQLEYYQDLIISNGLLQLDSSNENSLIGSSQNQSQQQQIPLYNNIREDLRSQSSWSFAKSLNLAYKSINELNEKCNNQNSFFMYCIYRGSKYEQNLEILGYPKTVLHNFLCLNDNQINYILMRRPFMTPKVLQNKYLEMFYSKTQAFKYQFSDHKNLIFAQNQHPFKFKENDFYDLLTVDNILVSFEVEYLMQNLSDYKDMCSDMLFIIKYKPVGNFKAEDIIKSQRFFRNNIVQKSGNSSEGQEEECNLSSEFNFYDIIYRAKSELFIEKYYNLIDSDSFHDINDFLN